MSGFWQGDIELGLSYFTEDITFVSFLQEQLVQGIDKVREILHQTSLQMPPVPVKHYTEVRDLLMTGLLQSNVQGQHKSNDERVKA